jgi:nucleotidyltransferase/DNA polymerase involved in DNA repair
MGLRTDIYVSSGIFISMSHVSAQAALKRLLKLLVVLPVSIDECYFDEYLSERKTNGTQQKLL